MKKYLLLIVLLVTVFGGFAQQELAYDQNPNFAISRDKYMKLSDSINSFQSTTAQQTYKAIDYLVDKREARDARRAERRQARRYNQNYYYDNNYGYYGNGGYNYGWNNNWNNSWNSNYYPGFQNNFRYRPYYRNHYRSNNVWFGLPFFLGAGFSWCR
jgi:hypothetical protein